MVLNLSTLPGQKKKQYFDELGNPLPELPANFIPLVPGTIGANKPITDVEKLNIAPPVIDTTTPKLPTGEVNPNYVPGSLLGSLPPANVTQTPVVEASTGGMVETFRKAQPQGEPLVIRAQRLAELGRQAQTEQLRRITELIGQGVPGQLTESVDGINPFNAATGAISGAGAAATLTAGIAGGTVASVATGGLAAVGLAVGGVVKAGSDMRNDVAQAKDLSNLAVKNFKFILNKVNAGLIDPVRAVELWNTSLMYQRQATANIKYLNRNDLTKFLGSGQQEQQDIENVNLILDDYNRLLATAILNPNTANIILPDVEAAE